MNQTSTYFNPEDAGQNILLKSVLKSRGTPFI